MAIGDAGAAKGLIIYPSTQAHSLGYQNDNQRADDIAAEIDARTTADAGKSNVGHTHPGTDITSVVAAAVRLVLGSGSVDFDGANWIMHGGLGVSGIINASGQLSTLGASDIVSARDVNAARNVNVSGHVFVPNSVAAVSGYSQAYINGDGRLSRGASARRFKQDIKSWSPDKQAVLAIQLHEFRLKEAVKLYGEDAPIDHGVIAEELVALGLEWLVFYDKKGRPLGVQYDRIALALLPVIQDHESRILKLEADNA